MPIDVDQALPAIGRVAYRGFERFHCLFRSSKHFRVVVRVGQIRDVAAQRDPIGVLRQTGISGDQRAARVGKCEVIQYAPTEIKKAVVGYGRADKQQIQAMVATLLGLKKVETSQLLGLFRTTGTKRLIRRF